MKKAPRLGLNLNGVLLPFRPLQLSVLYEFECYTAAACFDCVVVLNPNDEVSVNRLTNYHLYAGNAAVRR